MTTPPQAPELWHEIELRPELYDIDSMDVVWHGNYVRYMEAARAALLEKFNYGYPQMRESGYAWPVVDMRVKFVASATYGQRLIVRAEITEWEHRLRIDYLVRDALTGKKLTRAHTLQVAVSIATREMQFESPAILFDRLGVRP